MDQANNAVIAVFLTVAALWVGGCLASLIWIGRELSAKLYRRMKR
jgi:hypothetical protein